MSGNDTPLVLVTRPETESRAFLADLEAIAPPFIPVIAPAFELEAVAASVPPFDEAVFTSRAGVRFGPSGAGRVAWCVGTSTAAAAEASGYVPRDANGDVERLIDVILTKKPDGRLLHMRGETSKGDVSARLTESGVQCAEVILYRKAARQVAVKERARIDGAESIIVPVFSAETVSIIATWGLVLSGATVVAISEDVADAARALIPANIITAGSPNRAAMTQATARLIA